MNSRDSILANLRSTKFSIADLPDTANLGIHYANPLEVFTDSLVSVGGETVRLSSTAEIPNYLCNRGVSLDDPNVVNLCQDFPLSSSQSLPFGNSDQISRTSFALIAGEFGVSENGAVWVKEPSNYPRSVIFLTEHLGIVLSCKEIVSNMHQAYLRLSFSESGFGVFISGPSKTADIEQSLVIGAHGPKKHTVFLLD